MTLTVIFIVLALAIVLIVRAWDSYHKMPEGYTLRLDDDTSYPRLVARTPEGVVVATHLIVLWGMGRAARKCIREAKQHHKYTSR